MLLASADPRGATVMLERGETRADMPARHAPRVGDADAPASASDMAGESAEPSALTADAEDRNGLVVVACVRLGDVVAMLARSWADAVVAAGVGGVGMAAGVGGATGVGDMTDAEDAEVGRADTDDDADAVGGWPVAGVVPVAAAGATAAYFNGGSVGGAGRAGWLGRPALSTLDMGCWPKFGLGGGGRAGRRRRMGQGNAQGDQAAYCLLPLSVLNG
jgi:hypothetical protein